MLTLNERILGSLIGAAIGDTLGAPTELRTRAQIAEKFNGFVRDFFAPPDDTFARGNRAGQITDDFSMAWVTCQEILRHKGEISPAVARKALLEWSKDEAFFNQFVGPTSRAAIIAMRTDDAPPAKGEWVNENSRASNGAAMKSAPISLFAKGNINEAIRAVCTVGRVTHPNNISLAGAAAVAAATNRALSGGNLHDVMQSGLFGASEGNRFGLESGDIAAGPDMEKRIRLAIYLGSIAPSLDKATDSMAQYFDCSGLAADSVPVAFGLAVAADGDPFEAICACVNVGNDTDTIATMAGGILGAMTGPDGFPLAYRRTVEEVNHYDLQSLANQIESCQIHIAE